MNDAWTFPELKARLWVTAAGSWIQMVVASLAARRLVGQPNPARCISDASLAVFLIGGFATVLLNVNPLIPLDGYYALSDWLGGAQPAPARVRYTCLADQDQVAGAGAADAAGR